MKIPLSDIRQRDLLDIQLDIDTHPNESHGAERYDGLRGKPHVRALPFIWLMLLKGNDYYLFPSSLIAACAAAKRAIGTRKGEQET